ncbi:MAG: zinc ribbon domain-containing protein [Deltaproteobacteria bacterium]|jgi:putative FmdB family regulatory protein|nr:zinc ribbon domain-containing protein [Deltaproteobacteria bacterium]MBW2476164.1 zinc ribbon domain-containing protein [Deltaproteobacteria bacterium]MBW2520646.1 zinc ribbon domain-containing protein [Deltaproteobacteria bacterium]
MPVYEYLCEDCGNEFALKMPFSEHEKGGITCIACKSKNVRQKLSAFYAKTTKKS